MVNGTAWAGAVETVKYGVYLGIWTNWSRGRVLGATLTLSREDGNYVLAFTAFFIGLVSTRFWRILCFILHNSFSTSTPRDALYHQQQAILRNSDSADAGLLVFSQLAWAWRKTAKRAFVRVLPLIATAALSTVVFTIAGGFSSSISTGVGNDVLLDGSNCALVNTGYPDLGAASIIQQYVSRRASNAANYAQQCYSTNTSGMLNCGTFVKARIPSSVDYQTPCPFATGLCQSDANIRLDTGYIDSHEHLGLNAPPDERVMFRTVLQCAPLVTEGYTNNISTSGENYTAYYYGPDTSGNNYTYKTSTLDAQYHQTNGNEFILRALVAPTLNGKPSQNSAFTPTPGLFPTDGDLMLTFLVGNGVHFMEKAEDPWYRGTLPGKNVTWNGANGKLSKLSYRPEQAASPMACLRQFQFCNSALPEERRCGPLGSALDAQVQAAHLFNMTEDQIANSDIPDTPAGSRYVWFLEFLSLAGYGPEILVNYLGPNSLASQSSLSRYPGLLGAIPSNQWQLDVENWWAIHMALMQSGMVSIAYGNHDPALKPFEIPPFNSRYQKLCNNQKIVSTDYTSFSVFGICFIYVIGALIIAISYLLEHIQAWLYRHRSLNEYAYLEWTANETLQLQRMAYQGVGSGNWSRYTDRIPLTEMGDILADLHRSYPLDKKKEADVEQGNTVEKRTGTTVTTVQTAAPTEDETDGSSATPCDHNSQIDRNSVGGRQSVEAVSHGHIPQDDSIHSPVLPHVVTNPRPPADAAPMKVGELEPKGSRDPVITTPAM